MSGAVFGIAAGASALAALLGIRELRWRRRIALELSSEVALGILSSGDFEALRGWKRFRRSWLSGTRERRAFSRIAGRLARAKEAQKRASGERGRLLQVQVLTLRTRLRQMHATRRGIADPGAPPEPDRA
jgi:hypothetical protein